ncbi:hypothetical protein GIB67_005295 [Kingdonia uniflora]|uniref:Uncharacterized protein n=1 Tax=Kingdonia uniflora TaxID=39325 RepID=A0A7J7LCW2_9MAGN|nr:hypothetical protein GIB67_005295 [Kingdonia uniflora]
MRIVVGRRRKYHDDITVVVIILGNKQRTSTASTSVNQHGSSFDFGELEEAIVVQGVQRGAGSTSSKLLDAKVSTLSRGYPSSESAHGATTAGLTLNIDDEDDNNESNPQVDGNRQYCAYPAFLNCGNDNSDIFELENSVENQSDQEQNEFEDMNLEDLYAQTFAKYMKLGKLNKVLKGQVNTLTCELKEKTENTSHEIRVLENEKQGLHDKIMFLEKVHDAKEKMKSTLDELRSAKLDVVLS